MCDDRDAPMVAMKYTYDRVKLGGPLNDHDEDGVVDLQNCQHARDEAEVLTYRYLLRVEKGVEMREARQKKG